MMRFATLVLAASALVSPALADEPQVVVLRGASAPPTPWYEPPPQPTTVVRLVYVPFYYLPVASGPFFLHRQPFAVSARRNR